MVVNVSLEVSTFFFLRLVAIEARLWHTFVPVTLRAGGEYSEKFEHDLGRRSGYNSQDLGVNGVGTM